MSGKVASVVDIDKDWYWGIPLGLIEVGDVTTGTPWTAKRQDFVSVFNGYDGVMDYYRDLSLASDDKWRNMARKRDALSPMRIIYPGRKCSDRHSGSSAQEMWAYHFWPWLLGMSMSSVSGLRFKLWWVSSDIRGSYYALWCLEVGDVWVERFWQQRRMI